MEGGNHRKEALSKEKTEERSTAKVLEKRLFRKRESTISSKKKVAVIGESNLSLGRGESPHP